MFCFHDRLREFTFSDGALIKMCPDCTAFDTKRNEVLRSGSVAMPHAEDQIHWAELLDEAGFAPDAGQQASLTYVGDSRGVEKAQEEHATTMRVIDVFSTLDDLVLRRKVKRKPTTLDDHEWVARQRPFPHTHTMPRNFTAYCPHCTEVVLSVKRPWVVRLTKGAYLPIEHECNSVRVYNLKGNLLEVKGT